MSIGEQEGSQDTPMRNTTPMKRRSNPDPDAGPGPSKKAKTAKMNQCQTFFFRICKSRKLDDAFDLNFGVTDKHLSNVDQDIKSQDACIREAKDDNENLRLLIQRLEEKAEAAKQSENLVDITLRSRQAESADVDVPRYDDRHDDPIVHESFRAYEERSHSLKDALEKIDLNQKQLAASREQPRQIREDVPAQVERLRLEYEARLNQQRKELDEKARRRKEKFNNTIKEKQQIIDDEKLQAKTGSDHSQCLLESLQRSARAEELRVQLNAEWSSRFADVKMAIAELSTKLTVAEREKKEATSKLTETKSSLQSVTNSMAEWEGHALHNERLCSDLRRAEAEAASKNERLNRKLHETSQRLQDTCRSLIESKLGTKRTRMQLDTSRSNYETLLIDVTLVQKRKLGIARSQKTLLHGYLVQARSRVKNLESSVDKLNAQLKVKTIHMERQSQRSARNDKLLKLNTIEVESLGRRLTARQETLNEQRRRALADQIQVHQLNQTNNEHLAALERKDAILMSNATDISAKALEIRSLSENFSTASEELALQRSIVTHKAELIRALEDVNQNLLDQRSGTSAALTQLETEMSTLKLDLSTEKEKLESQVNLVSQRNAVIHELETTKLGLSDAKIEATHEIFALNARLSTLESDSRAKDEVIRAHTSAVALGEERVERLKIYNAELLEAQEKAKIDKINSQNDLLTANVRLEQLQTELDACERRLSAADKGTEQLRRSLSQIKNDLAIEKSANKTVSLQESLTMTESRLQTASTDLRLKAEQSEKEMSKNISLLVDNVRLEKEKLDLIKEQEGFDKYKKDSDDMLARNQLTIRNLQADTTSKSTLLDQLQAERAASNAERVHLLHQLMDQSVQLRRVADKLPKESQSILGDTQDVRMLPGVLSGEAVLLRVQKLPRERSALIVLEKSDHTWIVWHESLDKCTADMSKRDWFLYLDRGLNEPPIEVRLDDGDPYELEAWLQGPDTR